MDNIILANAVKQAAINETPIPINGDTSGYKTRNFQISPALLEQLPDEFIFSKNFSKFIKENEGLKISEVIRQLVSQGDKKVFINSHNDTAAFSVSSNRSPDVTFNTRAKNLLLSMYDDIIKEAEKSGNQKRVFAYKTVAEKIRNDELDEFTLYSNLLETQYNALRLVEYPIDDKYDCNIDKITGADTPDIKVKAENGWHYRMPKNQRQSKVVDRISVNALTSKELIKKLDNLFVSGRLHGYYKTPDMSDNWLERHDPVTIYLSEPCNNTILSTIEKEITPFIRSKKDVLIGEKFAPGFALQKSPNLNDIENILAEAKKLDSGFEQVLRKRFTRTGTNTLAMSAGEMEAMKRLLEELDTQSLKKAG